MESEEAVFLKTIIPSRKATQSYLGEAMMSKLSSEEREILEALRADGA